MFSNKSKVKQMCKQRNWSLFEVKENAEYTIRIVREDGVLLATGRSLYKNIAYDELWRKIKPAKNVKQIV